MLMAEWHAQFARREQSQERVSFSFPMHQGRGWERCCGWWGVLMHVEKIFLHINCVQHKGEYHHSSNPIRSTKNRRHSSIVPISASNSSTLPILPHQYANLPWATQIPSPPIQFDPLGHISNSKSSDVPYPNNPRHDKTIHTLCSILISLTSHPP